MFGFSNCDTVWLIIMTGALFLVFLGLYNLILNIIRKHKGVVMSIELEKKINLHEHEIVKAYYDDDGGVDMALYIDDLWAELEDLKELRGVYND